MISVYICEDNNEQRNRIKNIIDDTIMIENLDMQVVLDTGEPNDILSDIRTSRKNGLYFLDVDLKSNINGIQLAEKIREEDPRGFIVFITSHAEMSYLTFLYKVEAIDYIVKDNYTNIKSRVHDCILNAHKKYVALNNRTHKTVTIKSGDKLYNLDLENVIFFETASVIHKINVYTEDRKMEFYSQLKDIQEGLDSSFIRCHRSFIINKDKVKYVDYKERLVHMTDGSVCMASVRGIRLLKQQQL